MLDQHPMAWLDPLWERFHGLRRPPPATADDAVAVLRELGVAPEVTRWERTDPPRQDPEWVTRRLCLPAERVPEVAAALASSRRARGAPRPSPGGLNRYAAGAAASYRPTTSAPPR